MFRPPILHSTFTGVLDRSLFRKTFNIAAAAVTDKRKIAETRSQLQRGNQILVLDRVQTVKSHPNPLQADKGIKCLLLDPKVKPGGRLIHSGKLHDVIKS